MSSDIRNQGRIGEHHTAYRRGLVLGLTMAEVGIMIIFVLLLLIGLAALERQRNAAERQGKELIPSDRVQELESAEATLEAIANSVDPEGRATPEEIQELVRVAQEANRSAEGESNLRAANEALEEIRRTREEIRRIAERMKAGTGDEIVEIVEAQSRELANKEGQLQFVERRLDALGEGEGARPCWVEDDGKVVWLYDVILTNTGIKMQLKPEARALARFADLPIPIIDPAITMTEEEFRSQTRELYDYGRDSEDCRFHVWVWDGTGESEKLLYQRLLRTVEGHFYKQYRVPYGIPF